MEGTGALRFNVIYLVFGVATIGSVLAIGLSLVFPVFEFPQPTGPYAIGTLVYDWVDESRPEILTSNPNDHREVMVQIWYPAKTGSPRPKMPYLQNADIVINLNSFLEISNTSPQMLQLPRRWPTQNPAIHCCFFWREPQAFAR
ncbi:MAG: hypothetical protein ABIN69_06870 [Aestuariivirga sp.]